MKYTPKVHETPRLLYADAYTEGGDQFQSEKAREQSTYYITLRRVLEKIDPELYDKGDNRMLLHGIQRILHRILYKPIEMWEIEEADKFLEFQKVNAKGEFKRYVYPRELWVRIVNEFGGRIPIQIKALPEGSVVYPNEPVMQIRNTVEGFGELSVWFESKLLHIWGATEFVTRDMHFFDKVRKLYAKYFPDLTKEELNFYASIVLTNFADRAGLNIMESEDLGMYALYTFGGTDTFCGAYQAWKNGAVVGTSSSVYALAHRNVQAYDEESGAYDALYEAMEDDDYGSMVNDCYASRNAVKKYHVKLALKSKELNNGKIIVTRPDSGVALDEVMFTIRTAIENGLCAIKNYNGRDWYEGTYLHFIEGDGLTHHNILVILETMLENRYVPWTWGLFGMGGGQRNGLKRDNLSAKFALCAIGAENTGVVKFSDTYGKTTLPGPFKVLRSQDALDRRQTVVFEWEPGEDAMVIYYDGLAPVDFFDGGMLDDFNVIKQRTSEQFDSMPLTLTTEDNHNYPASDAVIALRKKLLEKYAPSKDAMDY